MNFETMDWEAEANRISHAFDLTPDCSFRPMIRHGANRLKRLGGSEPETTTGHGFYCVAGYCSIWTYSLYTLVPDQDKEIAFILQVHGGWRVQGNYHEAAVEMARGLYFLDLLTPEIENALQVSISTHQKIEWTLAHAALVSQS